MTLTIVESYSIGEQENPKFIVELKVRIDNLQPRWTVMMGEQFIQTGTTSFKEAWEAYRTAKRTMRAMAVLMEDYHVCEICGHWGPDVKYGEYDYHYKDQETSKDAVGHAEEWLCPKDFERNLAMVKEHD